MTTDLCLQLIGALQQIAHGRPDNGRPLSASNAQGVARDVLFECGLGWSHDVLRPAPGVLLREQTMRSADACDVVAAVIEQVGFSVCDKLAADIRTETMKLRAVAKAT